MSTNPTPRTDLALEAVSLHTDNSITDGITQRQYEENGFKITHVDIKTDKAQKKSGKKIGEYITVEIDDLSLSDVDTAAAIISEKLAEILKKHNLCGKTVLVGGIGNREITPDALGPMCADGVLATKHATDSKNSVFESFGSVAVIAPGVLAQTGLEASEIIKGIVKSNNIAAVIAVDALAASSISRLGKTIQITDTGISPGSGVQNSRKEISSDTVGVPVIALGVPTVADAYITASEDTDSVKMFITPRDIDEVVKKNARILSLAVNLALQPNFTKDDIAAMMS